MDLSALIFAALKSAKTANERIDNLPKPLAPMGTLGTGGTIESLPTASADNYGYYYVVITDGTYAGQSMKAGDTTFSNGTAWVLVPSADEPSVIDDSVTSTALTWSSSKIANELGGVVKTLTYIGNGQNTNEITFPETPKVILSIQGAYSSDGGWLFSDVIIWGFTEWGAQHLRAVTSPLGGSVTEWNMQTEFNGNKLIITGANASNAFNVADITFTVCYI